MSNFNIKERQVGEVMVLDLDGDMKIGESGSMFQRTIRRLLEEGQRKILLNLAGVEYIDSSGLGELIAGYTSLDKKDGEIKLLHLSRRVRELMVITKLLTVFDVHENESEALDSFNSSNIILGELSPPSLKGAAPTKELTP
jgi:anti-sigma B factor antagonist